MTLTISSRDARRCVALLLALAGVWGCDGAGAGQNNHSTESCGDGVVDAPEQCDGDELAGASCASLGLGGGTLACAGCRFDYAGCESQPACGNGAREGGEVCDDGNTTDGDGCSGDCSSNETYGNSTVDPGEACDDGNLAPSDGCSAVCGLESCGNGVLDPGEVCDDGNTAGGDGCSADCGSTESCGNALRSKNYFDAFS